MSSPSLTLCFQQGCSTSNREALHPALMHKPSCKVRAFVSGPEHSKDDMYSKNNRISNEQVEPVGKICAKTWYAEFVGDSCKSLDNAHWTGVITVSHYSKVDGAAIHEVTILVKLTVTHHGAQFTRVRNMTVTKHGLRCETTACQKVC